MIRLDVASYCALTCEAEVLEADGFGEKVLRLPDGSIVKLFRRKRLLSSALWNPYARRFADNCKGLSKRGIPCPEVIAVYRIAEICRDAVHYHPLPGRTIRQIREAGISEPESAQLRRRLGIFVTELHALGVYFRSLHLGNIVLTPDDRLGLIDVADMRLHPRALNKFQRQRNQKHLTRYKEEGQWLLAGDDFIGNPTPG